MVYFGNHDLWPLRSRWWGGCRSQTAGARWSKVEHHRPLGSYTERDPECTGAQREKTSTPPEWRDPNPAWRLLQSERRSIRLIWLVWGWLKHFLESLFTCKRSLIFILHLLSQPAAKQFTLDNKPGQCPQMGSDFYRCPSRCPSSPSTRNTQSFRIVPWVCRELRWCGSDPVVSSQTVHLHLTATHSECKVSERLPLPLVPVHVKVQTPENAQDARCSVTLDTIIQPGDLKFSRTCRILLLINWFFPEKLHWPENKINMCLVLGQSHDISMKQQRFRRTRLLYKKQWF